MDTRRRTGFSSSQDADNLGFSSSQQNNSREINNSGFASSQANNRGFQSSRTQANQDVSYSQNIGQTVFYQGMASLPSNNRVVYQNTAPNMQPGQTGSSQVIREANALPAAPPNSPAYTRCKR